MRMVDPIRTGLNGRPFLDYALLDFGQVTSSTRIIKDNPFGNNTKVVVVGEVLHNGVWSATDMVKAASSWMGTKANYVEGVGIVVQVGPSGAIAKSAFSGAGHGSGASASTVQCRVHVWRVGA